MKEFNLQKYKNIISDTTKPLLFTLYDRIDKVNHTMGIFKINESHKSKVFKLKLSKIDNYIYDIYGMAVSYEFIQDRKIKIFMSDNDEVDNTGLIIPVDMDLSIHPLSCIGYYPKTSLDYKMLSAYYNSDENVDYRQNVRDSLNRSFGLTNLDLIKALEEYYGSIDNSEFIKREYVVNNCVTYNGDEKYYVHIEGFTPVGFPIIRYLKEDEKVHHSHYYNLYIEARANSVNILNKPLYDPISGITINTMDFTQRYLEVDEEIVKLDDPKKILKILTQSQFPENHLSDSRYGLENALTAFITNRNIIEYHDNGSDEEFIKDIDGEVYITLDDLRKRKPYGRMDTWWSNEYDKLGKVNDSNIPMLYDYFSSRINHSILRLALESRVISLPISKNFNDIITINTVMSNTAAIGEVLKKSVIKNKGAYISTASNDIGFTGTYEDGLPVFSNSTDVKLYRDMDEIFDDICEFNKIILIDGIPNVLASLVIRVIPDN